MYFGGYSGAALLVRDRERWSRYILDSLVETTVSRDILLLSRVEKPALLRRLFRLGCEYSGRVLSYQKMIGQLQDAGNTTTLAHYLDLLAGAGMLTGLQKYSGSRIRQRGSSPKLLALNGALVSAWDPRPLREARGDPQEWGRLVETAVGAHLVAAGLEAFYWRDRNREVDFVVRRGSTVVALEVTIGRRKDCLPGMRAFAAAFRPRGQSWSVDRGSRSRSSCSRRRAIGSAESADRRGHPRKSVSACHSSAPGSGRSCRRSGSQTSLPSKE